MSFYLTKRVDEKQCNVGDRCMVLADFSGIKAGHKGTIEEIYAVGVMVEWDVREGTPHAAFDRRQPLRDGFSREDLQYLAFETKKHPKVDPTVTIGELR